MKGAIVALSTIAKHDEDTIDDLYPKESYLVETTHGCVIVKQNDDVVCDGMVPGTCIGLEWYKVIGVTDESIQTRLVAKNGQIRTVQDPLFRLQLVAVSPRKLPSLAAAYRWPAPRPLFLRKDTTHWPLRNKLLPVTLGQETLWPGSIVGAKIGRAQPHRITGLTPAA